jgi:uncharacterized protein YkwD
MDGMPLSLRRKALAVGCSLTLGVAACSGPPARQPMPIRRPIPIEQSASDTGISDRAEAVVQLHNQERSKRKLPSLEVSEPLREAAERQARDMARRGRMAHRGSDGTSPMDRIKQAGYDYQRAGENVAYGQSTPEEVTHGWMTSPPHRKNILGEFSQIGAACATAKDGTFYWCVTFGDPIRR